MLPPHARARRRARLRGTMQRAYCMVLHNPHHHAGKMRSSVSLRISKALARHLGRERRLERRLMHQQRGAAAGGRERGAGPLVAAERQAPAGRAAQDQAVRVAAVLHRHAAEVSQACADVAFG